MERRESKFSPRSRKLISRAFGLGINPSQIDIEMLKALSSNDGIVTRDRLANLRKEIETIVERRKLNV